MIPWAELQQRSATFGREAVLVELSQTASEAEVAEAIKIVLRSDALLVRSPITGEMDTVTLKSLPITILTNGRQTQLKVTLKGSLCVFIGTHTASMDDTKQHIEIWTANPFQRGIWIGQLIELAAKATHDAVQSLPEEYWKL